MLAIAISASMCYDIFRFASNKFNEVFVANISIRKLDKTAYEQLRLRATKHGVSMEEEARQIIYQAVSAPEYLSSIFQKYFGQENGVDIDALHQRKPHEPMDFNE